MRQAQKNFGKAVRSLGTLLVVSCIPLSLFAQTGSTDDSSTPLAFEGVGDDIDKHRRSPVVITRVEKVDATETEPARTKILADSYMPNSEFQKYPTRYDFYVERKFFTSQLRSESQPGPIGIDVGHETAQMPFRYTVVATVLHPNRQYLTVAEGIAEVLDRAAELDCSLTTIDLESEEEESDSLYVANDVEVIAEEEGDVAFDFSADEETGESEASVLSGLSYEYIDETKESADVSGSLTVNIDGEETEYQVEGDATFENGVISDLSVSSEDGELDLQCS